MRCIICGQKDTEKWYYNVCKDCSTLEEEYKHNPTLTTIDYRFKEDVKQFYNENPIITNLK